MAPMDPTYTIDSSDERIIYLANGRVALVVPLVLHAPGPQGPAMAYRPGGRVRKKPKSGNLAPERVAELYELLMTGSTPEELDATTPVSRYTLREIRAGRWPGVTDEVKRRHGVWRAGEGRVDFSE